MRRYGRKEYLLATWMKKGGCLAPMNVAGLGVLGKVDVNDADNVLGTQPDTAIAARQVKDWTPGFKEVVLCVL
jgi:hypothetical protein